MLLHPAAVSFFACSIVSFATADKTPSEEEPKIIAPSLEEKEPEKEEEPEKEKSEAMKETEALLQRLTLTMGLEVGGLTDNLSFTIKDKDLGKAILKLANVFEIPELAEKCQGELDKLISKQMVWWERNPSTLASEKSINGTTYPHIVADVWTMEGVHIPTELFRRGCAAISTEHPNSRVDMKMPEIFSARAEKEKEERMKELRDLQHQIEKNARGEKNRKRQEKEAPPLDIVSVLALLALGLFFLGVIKTIGRRATRKKKVPVMKLHKFN